jgi:hypothetical protein
VFGLEGTKAIADLLTTVTRDAIAKDQQRFHGVEFCAGTFFPFLGEEAAAAEALAHANLRAIVQVHTCGYPVPPAYDLKHKRAAGLAGGAGNLQPAWKEHADSLRFHAENMATRLQLPEGSEGLARLRAHHPEFKLGPSSQHSRHPVIAAINCHGGKDSLPADDALRFLEAACGVERDVGIPICHETHRQRIFHNPFVLRTLRDELPSTLKLNCDLSHFVVALERVMSDVNDAEFWPELLRDVIARRAYLMHCRVGTPQSPQLQDPRPAHAQYVSDNQLEGYTPSVTTPAACAGDDYAAVEAHVGWWRIIAASMRERGVPVRVVPEYGPAPYQAVDDSAALDAICRDAERFLSAALRS